jgi:CRP-like cAMP-binding protein
MNEVAAWAKQRALFDFAGDECVPLEVSLFAAHLDGAETRLAQLQARDGYARSLEVAAIAAAERSASPEEVLQLLRAVRVFQCLTDAELRQLSTSARPIRLGPVERILVQGRPGTSVFVVADGKLEVLVRQPDGHDLPVATRGVGKLVGEGSLLTGLPRQATVRSTGAVLLYEIGEPQLAPILEARPEALASLAGMLGPRAHASETAARDYRERLRASRLLAALRRMVRLPARRP